MPKNENPYSSPIIIDIDLPLNGKWDDDKHQVESHATQPVTAEKFYDHAASVLILFQCLTHGTSSAPRYPERSGFIRKIYDELSPIAHFAKLYFNQSNAVLIQWHSWNQNFDAEVVDIRHKSSWLDYLEVTTLQGDEDAKLLKDLSLSETGCVLRVGNLDQEEHLRKLDQLRRILKKKGEKKYPPNTALLVYTDENRFKGSYIGTEQLKLNKKTDFMGVLDEMKSLLVNFSYVFIYSKDEIYATISFA